MAESWTLVTTIKNHLNSFAISCYRVMLNIKRTGRIRDDRILYTSNRRNLADLLIERQLRTLGLWLRKKDLSIKTYALYTTNRRQNRRRRPRHTYAKLTQQTTGLSIEEMKLKAMGGSEWRHVVGRVDPQTHDEAG